MITICLDCFVKRVSVLPFIHIITWGRFFLHRNKSYILLTILIKLITYILLIILIALITYILLTILTSLIASFTYCLRFW